MTASLPPGPALIRISALVGDRYDAIGAELGVTFREGRLLIAVTRRPQTVGALGAYVRAGKSTMTGVLARMVSDGLVRRVPDPDDRRATLVEPTERGREVAHTLESRVRAAVTELLAPLEEADRTELAGLLSRVLSRADEVDGVLLRSE